MSGVSLFSCGGAVFCAEHVLTAADEWGQLTPVRSQVRERLSALAQAQADGFQVADDLLQARSEAFRRDLGLRSAQATQEWMDAHGVSIEAFGDYLEREACREHYTSNALPFDAAAESISAKDVDEVLWPDLVFSGNVQPWCQQLAEIVAIVCSLKGPDHVDADLATWPERLTAYGQLQEQFRADLLTTTRLKNALRAQYHDFFLLHAEIGIFDNDAAVREAVLCITEDGLSMEKVCEMAKGDFMHQEALLNQLPPDLQTAALSAAPGSVLPPFEQAGRHILMLVQAKKEPDLADERTRSLLSQRLVTEAIRPLVHEHIQWMGATSQ